MSKQSDLSGQDYTSPDSKPASDGTSVQIHTGNGHVQGTIIGGYVVPNKQS